MGFRLCKGGKGVMLFWGAHPHGKKKGGGFIALTLSLNKAWGGGSFALLGGSAWTPAVLALAAAEGM